MYDRAVADDRERACGFSGCDRVIRYRGRGRPKEYCDRVWPDGESCQQKAEQQRAAAKAAGLDVPLEAYRQITAATRPALEAAAGQLSELLNALRAVESGALERITAAETAAVAAAARAEDAERDRDTAVSRAGVADQRRREALEAQRLAERHARAAEKTIEETEQRCWRDIADEFHRRGQAEAARDEARAQLEALQRRYDQLAADAEDTVRRNVELTAQLAAAHASLDAERTGRAAAETARDAAREESARAATAATGRAEQAEAQAATLRTELDESRQVVAAVRERVAAAERERDQIAETLAVIERERDQHAEAHAAAEQRLRDRDSELDRLRGELTKARARAETALTREQLTEMITAAIAPNAQR